MKVHTLKEKWSDHLAEFGQLKKKYEEAENRKKVLEVDNEAYKRDFLKDQAKMRDLQADLEKYKDEKAFMNDDILAQYKDYEAKLSEKEKESIKLKSENDRLRRERDRLRKGKGKFHEDLSQERVDAQQVLEAKCSEYQGSLKDLSQRLQNASQQEEFWKSKSSWLDQQLELVIQHEKAWKTECSELHDALEKLNKQLEAKDRKKQEMEDDLTRMYNDLDADHKRLKETNQRNNLRKKLYGLKFLTKMGRVEEIKRVANE